VVMLGRKFPFVPAKDANFVAAIRPVSGRGSGWITQEVHVATILEAVTTA
jgi:hypothetical protein